MGTCTAAGVYEHALILLGHGCGNSSSILICRSSDNKGPVLAAIFGAALSRQPAAVFGGSLGEYVLALRYGVA